MSCLINPFVFAAGGGGGGINPTWTGISGATESPTGLLTKTASQAWGNCGAVSVETEAGDWRLTYYLEDPEGHDHWFFGFGADTSCNTFATVDFAFLPRQANLDAQVWESGSQPGGSPATSHASGDHAMLEIERVGTEVKYYFLNYLGTDPRPSPGDAGRTLLYTSLVSSSGTLTVSVAGFFNGAITDADDFILTAI